MTGSGDVIACPNCGSSSPNTFRFCPHCGVPLATADTGRGTPRIERKVVTVLFCDLAGFTMRSDQADPEDVRAMLLPFHALAKESIERFGGTLDKFIGDAAMGVFGWPAVHEDDPERAVRAALAILDGVRELNEGRLDDLLTVRVGVNTGVAAVTLAAGVQLGENVAGDVVNTASRLETAAPLGSAIVSETTYQATKELFDYEALDPVSVKGKAETLPVWRPIAARAPVGAALDRDYSTPFVGREAERALLHEMFRRTHRERSMQLAILVAEPGAGKSRLVAQFRAELEARGDRVSWHRGRSLPYGEGVTFSALEEIVKGHAGILESDPPDVRGAKLDASLGEVAADPSERAWLQARLAPLAGIGSEVVVERDEAFASWARFLERLAGKTPLVVVIEDVHWADPAMLAFLEHVCSHGAGVPVLVIATARPELHDGHPNWAEDLAAATTVSLSPLTEEETARLVTGLFATEVLPPATRALLLDRAGGNPLYAEEFVRMLADRGLVDGRGRLATDLKGVAFPDSVQALIAARLDTLSPQRKDVVHDASVIGATFWPGAVAFLGERDERTVRSELAELARKELVRPEAVSTIHGEEAYSFWHALVRDVGYEQIPRATRAAKHRLVAGWVEAMAGDRVADFAEVLAHHATSALELARAARETGGLDEIQELARRYLRLAGIRAMALDVAKAEEHLRRALELTPPDHPDRPRIEAGLGEVALQDGRFDDADELYVAAVEELSAQGATDEAAEAMVRLSVVTEYRGDPSRSRVILEEAIETLSAMPPGPALARAFTESAGSLLATGRNVELVRRADRAIELAAATGEVEAETRAHGFRGYARTVLGDLDGIGEQREALAAGLRLGFARSTAVAYSNLGSSLMHAEGPRPAMQVFRQGMAFSETRGLKGEAEWFRNLILSPLIELGDWDEALHLATSVVDDARRRGAVYEEVYAAADGATVLSRQGAEAAARESESVLERARGIGDPPLLFGALLAAGRVRLDAGDLAGAGKLAQEAFEVSAAGALAERAGDIVHLVELAVRAGEPDLGERMLEGADAFPLPKHKHGLIHARAIAAEARGRCEEAAELYGDAAERWAGFGLPYERGLALLGAGRCLWKLGWTSEANRRLAEARDLFAELGARPMLAQVDAFVVSPA